MRISNTMSQPRDKVYFVCILFYFVCVFVYLKKGQYLKYVGMQSLAIKYNDDVLFITLCCPVLGCLFCGLFWGRISIQIYPPLALLFIFSFYFMLTFLKKIFVK